MKMTQIEANQGGKGYAETSHQQKPKIALYDRKKNVDA